MPPQSVNSQEQLDNLLNAYLGSLDASKMYESSELEARFGTRGIKPITKIDFDSILKFINLYFHIKWWIIISNFHSLINFKGLRA